ncbi:MULTISPECIES: hypothetical protein [Actinoplanes]|uniref:hypothetical protein n=1 Tax=Actinoplanes TaxID=1865 RepID=UPI0005F2CB15|nr:MULTISPECIES: hypothetical protein [Actinoplanes]GLY07337.1 hypothetical protein Acsp01_77160 [Actinoplanes sp. NBRC 101535]
MSIDDLTGAILRRLAEQDRVVPEYLVRDALAAALGARFPGVDPGVLRVPVAVADELITGFCTPVDAAEEDAATMPAVLSGDETGRVITALGMAVHITAFNLDRDRLLVAQVLNGAAAALVAVGAAARAAHDDGTAAVLLSPATLRTVRGTLDGVLSGLRDRDWQDRHLDRSTTATLIIGVLDLIGDAP